MNIILQISIETEKKITSAVSVGQLNFLSQIPNMGWIYKGFINQKTNLANILNGLNCGVIVLP